MPRCEMCGEWPHCPWQTDPDVICSEYHQKPVTNYDLLRAKSVEEMAEFLTLIMMGEERSVPFIYSTVDKWLDWLKQEADDAD